jgi:glutathione peroxidase
MLRSLVALTILLVLSPACLGREKDDKQDPGPAGPILPLLDLTVNRLDGQPQPLSVYRGKVLLVVNTASQCGYTPQYEGLEKLYQEYKGRGVVVLGFPSNDFGGQEPGAAPEIAKFCRMRYGVTFPLFAKIKTRPGPDQSPVFRFVTAKHGVPQWNFFKYLVGKDGQVKKMFPSAVAPESKALRDAIEAALNE